MNDIDDDFVHSKEPEKQTKVNPKTTHDKGLRRDMTLLSTLVARWSLAVIKQTKKLI